MQIEDVPSVKELGLDKQRKQGTMEREFKIELDEYKREIAREVCRKAWE